MTLDAKFTDETLDLKANVGAVQIIQTVKPIPVEADMTQPVGVDSEGKLFTLPSPDIATVKVEPTEEGALIKVTNRAGVTTATPILHGTNGKDGADGFSPIIELNPTDSGVQMDIITKSGGAGVFLSHGKSAYEYAKEGGYLGTEEEFATLLASGIETGVGDSVTAFGAKGDGKTDDTDAFREALASERAVFVPGGTYKLTAGITVGDNCCLELSQDTVLNFTNTTGNCITLGMLSHLKGNHATVNVPYAFSGNVLYAYSNEHTNAEIKAVPPFTQWDPQWKSGRYVTDLNICKADHRGYHYAVNPDDCKGTAVYLSADNTAGMSTFMWGIHYSGLRIAGAFAYGIRAVNYDNGWLHEMRIDAFIDACEIGVSLEDCNNAYVSAIVQPRRAYLDDDTLAETNRYVPYAKHGIQLIRSKNADLSGSRVWDWVINDPAKRISLWTDGGEYQHLAMIGDCSGAILNDYAYHTNGNTRQYIYTDRLDNFDKMTVLQEPIDTWFKVKEGEPYFFNGLANQRIVTKTELEKHFDTDFILKFTDMLPVATDENGVPFNGVGYGKGYLDPSGSVVYSDYYVCTGFIPWAVGQKLYAHDMVRAANDSYFRFCLYDANKNFIRFVPGSTLTDSSHYVGFTENTGGFVATLNNVIGTEDTAYVRISMYHKSMGEMPMVAIDEPIEYSIEGFLADSVKVKGENVIGEVGTVPPDWVATHTYTEGAPVYDEQNLFFEDRSSVYLTNYGGGFKINLGLSYDVYWDGERYTCEAKAYDGEPYLGNGSLVFGVENTGEPFCLYGSFISADTIAYVKKDSDETETIALKVTTEGNAEYSKLPKEYLPDDIGGSIDVTAKVGQTIIVREADGNGKPTKWESADYQPRTHWETKSETAIFEANEFTVGSDGAYFLQNAFTLSAGTKYAVVWDGVEYTCEAEAGTYSGAPMIYMGNPVIIGGEMNELPFAIGTIPGNGANAIASLIPNSTHSVAIYPYDVHKIPSKYVPSTALFIEVEVTGKDTEIDYNVNYGGSISDLDQAYAEGRPIWAVVRDADDISGMDGYMLPLIKRAEYPEIMSKGYLFESICNTSQLQLSFIETKGVQDVVLTVRTFNDLIDKRLRELGLID